MGCTERRGDGRRWLQGHRHHERRCFLVAWATRMARGLRGTTCSPPSSVWWAAVNVPVTADIEGGFSSTTSDLLYRIEEVIGVGATGVNLEDGVGPRASAAAAGRSVRAHRGGSSGRDEARRSARDQCTHGCLPERGQQRPVTFRCDAGALPGVSSPRARIACIRSGLLDLAQISKLVAELKAPVNIIGRPGTPSIVGAAGRGCCAREHGHHACAVRCRRACQTR